jgi:uncharacterized membrane protein
MENVAQAGMIGPAQIILAIVMVGVIVWWIASIAEIADSKFPKKDDKTIWLLVVILLGLLGILIYYGAGRSTRIKDSNKEDILDKQDELLDNSI